MDAYHLLFNQLNEQSILLTPNQRLSATLHKLYAAYQLQQNNNHWLTVDILPINTWIERLWNEQCHTNISKMPYLLNRTQQQALWEKIIKNSPWGAMLLQIDKTAELALNAWRLVKEWQVTFDDVLWESTPDCSAFKAWAKEYLNICIKNSWIDEVLLVQQLTQMIAQQKPLPAKKIILVGFSEISPQWQLLFSELSRQNNRDLSNWEVSSLCLPEQLNDISVSSFVEEEAEWRAMALKAKALQAQNNTIKIGCVIPHLEKKRDRVMQIFAEVFAAKYSYPAHLNDYPVNISAGKHLSNYPIIHTAFTLLNLYQSTINLETFSYLLASPFLGEAERERYQRATLDVLLRQANLTQISIDYFFTEKIQLLKQQIILEKNCPLLIKRLKAFYLELSQLQQQKKSYREWFDYFNHLLNILGWPGERSLNSEEYQVATAWLQLRESFATMDYIHTSVHYEEAYHWLKKMAAKIVFQTESPEANIQILGILEAAGLPFDVVWLSGMNDLSWPPKASPHPFIPKRIQTQLKMPHATPDREWEYCQQLLTQFKKTSSQLILSYSEKKDDIEMAPSPFIINFPQKPFVFDDTLPAHIIYQTKNLEHLLDDYGPPVNSTGLIRGGINIIKTQALCPFKSFAEWRLYAQPLDMVLPGLRAKERGILVHYIMELFWNEMHDQETLLNCTTEKIAAVITQCINRALQHIPGIAEKYLLLEKKRLNNLIHHWVALEKLRPPFKVLIHEKEAQVKINELQFSIRIDRIDQLVTNQKLIIDYKTGKNNNIQDWLTDLLEPQLPLYTLLEPTETVGIAFAQININEVTFKGISQFSLDIPGIVSLAEIKKCEQVQWGAQLKCWHDRLAELSTQFQLGWAAVLPHHATDTCTHCALQSFCRIKHLEGRVYE